MATRSPSIVIVLLSVAVSIAAAEPDEGVREALEALRAGLSEEHVEDRCEAVAAAVEHVHVEIVDVLGKKALRDASPEVRDVAAQVLGRMKALADRAGPFLRDEIARNDEHPGVQVTLIRSIARLGYGEARKELQAALRKHFREEKYRWVTTEVLRAFATLKDVKSLPFLLRLYEYKGRCPRRVEAGPAERAGTDAEAKRRYEAKHGKGRKMPKGKGETVDALWWQHLVASVKALTGQEFEDAKAFREWLKANARKLGIDPKELGNRRRL
jgi:hypothetical protein